MPHNACATTATTTALRPWRSPAGDCVVEGENAVSERNHHDCRGSGESQPGRASPRESGLPEADADTDLTRARSRKHLTEGDEVGEGALLRPCAAHHELFPEVADVRYRSSERGKTKPEKGEEDARGRLPFRSSPRR